MFISAAIEETSGFDMNFLTLPVPGLNIPLYIPLFIIIALIILLFIILIFTAKKKADKYNFDNVSECIKALNDESEEVRVRSCWALMVHKAPESEQPLLRLLLDNSKFVRGATASALGNLKKEESLKSLEEAKAMEKDEFTKSQIDKAIRKIKGEEMPRHDRAESIEEKGYVEVKMESGFDKASTAFSEDSEGKKGKKGLFSKSRKPAPNIIGLLENIPELSEVKVSGEISEKKADEEKTPSIEIAETCEEIAKVPAVTKPLVPEKTTGKTCEITFEITPETESSVKILKKLQELQSDGVSFKVNLKFNWKE